MTDKEIIKALECCGKVGPCKGCPCYIDNEHTECKKAYNSALDLINRQQAEIERYKGVIKILEKDVENERIDAQEFYNRLKTAEFEPIPIEIKDYAEGYNKAMRDVRMYMVYEYGVKPLSREQAEQALRKEDEGK